MSVKTHIKPRPGGPFQETALKNGMRIATESLLGARSVALAVSVDVGARYESAEESGRSHFLEHMAFKGTKRHSARAIAESFDAIGASINAYTSSEQTVYYVRLLPQDLPLAVEMLADILQNSVFDPEELERERNVILQEIAMHQDAPEDLVFDYFHERVYPDQSLGRSILGTPPLIAHVTRDDLVGYMQKHYTPARMVVSAAGVVDHAELVKLIEKHFIYPTSPKAEKPLPAKYVGGDIRKAGDFEQMHLIVGLPGMAYSDPDYYACQIMTTVLGGGMSSRLFQEVREKRGLAYSVYGFMSSYADSGMFGMYAAANEQSAAELGPVLCDELMKLADEGIEEKELQRAVRQHTAGLQMMRENVSSVAEWIGRHLLVYGRYIDADELAGCYESITCDAVQRAAQRLIGSGPLTVAVLGPQKGLAEYETLQKRLQK